MNIRPRHVAAALVFASGLGIGGATLASAQETTDDSTTTTVEEEPAATDESTTTTDDGSTSAPDDCPRPDGTEAPAGADAGS